MKNFYGIPRRIYGSKTIHFSILVLACFFCFDANSQKKDSTLRKMYFQSAAGISSNNGAPYEFGVQAILKNNWVASVSYHGIQMDPKNLPSDYAQATVGIFPIFFPVDYPYTEMKIFSVTGGKCFEVGRKVWFTVEGGLSLVNGEELVFTRQHVVVSPFGSSSNYAIETEGSKTTVGGMLKSDFNWAFSRYVGLGAGVFANFNSIQSPVGGQVKIIIGWLNRKKKQ